MLHECPRGTLFPSLGLVLRSTSNGDHNLSRPVFTDQAWIQCAHPGRASPTALGVNSTGAHRVVPSPAVLSSSLWSPSRRTYVAHSTSRLPGGSRGNSPDAERQSVQAGETLLADGTLPVRHSVSQNACTASYGFRIVNGDELPAGWWPCTAAPGS